MPQEMPNFARDTICSPLVMLTAKLSWQNSHGRFVHMLLTAAAATKRGLCLFHSAILEA